MDDNTYKYKAVDLKSKKAIAVFRKKNEITSWIDEQINLRGLDGRAGYFVQFRDGLTVEVFKMNGKKLKM